MTALSGLRRRDDDPPAGDVRPGERSAGERDADVSPPLVLATDRPVRRLVFVVLGILCVGIAAVGVIVPGLPTAIWLIAASYLFVRSHPPLEAKLIRNRFFGPYLRYVDNPRSMPRRAKFVACGLMWASVLTSVGVLTWRGTAGPWFSASLIAAAALGTWVIIRLRPKA